MGGIMDHAALLLITATVTITLFFGLAVYVTTRNPFQPASWIFGLLGLTIAGIYLTSLLIHSDRQTLFSIRELRITFNKEPKGEIWHG